MNETNTKNVEDNSVPIRLLPAKKPGIYMILCKKTNWRYYGESKNVSGRFATHRYKLRRKIHKTLKLQLDWDLYGESEFDFKVLHIGPDWVDITKRREEEEKLISQNKQNSYNLCESLSRPGDKNPFWGKSHSENSKRQISSKMSGKDKLGRQVVIKGTRYPSIAEASRQTGFSRKEIRARVNSSDWDWIHWFEYGT